MTSLTLITALLSGDIALNPGPLSGLPANITGVAALQPSHLRKVATPGDGHCLFHAASLSLRLQLNINKSSEDIITATRLEMLHNHTCYTVFGFSSFENYCSLTDNYLIHKVYNSNIGDVAPLAVANALSTQIIILDDITSSIHVRATIEPRLPSGKSIMIHLLNEHYSGVKLETPHVNSAGALTVSNFQMCDVAKPTSQNPIEPCSDNLLQTDNTSSATPCRTIDVASPWFFLRSNDVSILHLNIQGLLGQHLVNSNLSLDTHSKLDFLKFSAECPNSPTLICLTETKLSAKIEDREITLPGYSVYRRDRDRRGGGVAIYSRSDVRVEPMTLHCSSVEHCALRIMPTSGQPFILCCAYRPPSARVEWIIRFHSLLDSFAKDKMPLILAGDFNFNLLTDDSFATDLKSEYHLSQLITEPTRHAKSSSTLIDHLYTSDRSIVCDCGVVNLHLSDHCAIFCHLAGDRGVLRRPKQILTFRSFRRLNKAAFVNDLNAAPWSLLQACDNIDDEIDTFNKLYFNILDAHAPIKKKPAPKQQQPWMSRDLVVLMRSRDALYRKYLNCKTDDAWLTYKLSRNRCITAIRTAKRSFLIDSARSNPQKFWRQVKACTGLGKMKYSQHPWPCSTNDISRASANAVNLHFIDSVSSLITSDTNTPVNNLCTSTNESHPPAFDFQTIAEAEVTKAIEHLNPTAGAGADGISARMLKLAPSTISSVLTSIINRSLTTASFPTLWKMGIVTPVHKRGCKFNISNYRPITILPILSRVFERILSRQISSFLEDENLLSPQQHGFRQLRSCQSALISLTNRLFANRSAGIYSAVATLDFSKAFDCLNHEFLLGKMSCLGFSDGCIKWFRSYLTGRLQRVKYNECLSDSLPITSGVPQGSVLGPQLFNIYINDLLTTLPKEGSVCYADDLTLIGKGDTAVEALHDLQTLVDKVSAWSHANMLTLNAKKCSVMIVSAKLRGSIPSSPPIMLDGSSLETVRQITLLGVIIADDLSWSLQANKVRAKVNGRLGVLRRFGRVLNTKTRLQLYNAFVKPHLMYCLPVWGNCRVSNQHDFDRALRRCACFVLNDSSVTLSKTVYEFTYIGTFACHVLFANAVTMFKTIHNVPLDDFSCVNLSSSVCCRTSRATESNKIVARVLKHKSDNFSFLYGGVNAWNTLPNVLTSVCNMTLFVRELKKFLANHAF